MDLWFRECGANEHFRASADRGQRVPQVVEKRCDFGQFARWFKDSCRAVHAFLSWRQILLQLDELESLQNAHQSAKRKKTSSAPFGSIMDLKVCVLLSRPLAEKSGTG